MADRADITPELIRQLLRYDPDTGKYFWKSAPRELFCNHLAFHRWNNKNVDTETMNCITPDGYITISILSHTFRGHRVVWAYHYGEWPNREIDHINGIRSDNRIENLRDVDATENSKNRGLYQRNTSGHAGVFWNKRDLRWQANIRTRGKQYFLGSFREKDDAIKARKMAEKRLGFHPNNGQARGKQC